MAGRPKKIKEKELLEAIKDSYGLVTKVAEKLQCSWATADRAIKESETASRAMQDENEKLLDFAEGQAIKRMKDGDGVMVRFYLSTKGKKRGFTYDERIEGDDTAKDTEINITVGEDVEPVKADE